MPQLRGYIRWCLDKVTLANCFITCTFMQFIIKPVNIFSMIPSGKNTLQSECILNRKEETGCLINKK